MLRRPRLTRGPYCLPNTSQTPKSILVFENLKLEMALTAATIRPPPRRSCKDGCALIISEFEQKVSGALESTFATRLGSQKPATNLFELASGHLRVSRFGTTARKHELDTLQTLKAMRLRWSVYSAKDSKPSQHTSWPLILPPSGPLHSRGIRLCLAMVAIPLPTRRLLAATTQSDNLKVRGHV